MRVLRRLSLAALAAAALLNAAPARAADGATAYLVPKPVERGLKNQMRVLVIEDHRLPMVHYRFMIRAGGSDEAAEKAGLANLLLEVMRQGTERRDAKALSSEIDNLGGAITTSATRDYMVISGQFLSRDCASAASTRLRVRSISSPRNAGNCAMSAIRSSPLRQSRERNCPLITM